MIHGLGAMCCQCLEAVEHLLVGDVKVFGDVGDGGRTGACRAELLVSVLDPEDELLQSARQVDCPPFVAEVALELSEDRGDGKRRERDASVGIEPVDRVQQSQARDLY
jgi:hypothetical protein